jgi:hypothetical protein
MVSGTFAEMTPFLRHLGMFYMPQIYDMGPTTLLCNYITLKFVVSDGHHSVSLQQFVLFAFSLHSCHHRAAVTSTDSRIAPSVTSTVTSPRLHQRSAFIPTLLDHMNYPHFSTCSQAIRGRACAQEDSGCFSIEHVCLLNIVLVAKPDISFTKLAHNT